MKKIQSLLCLAILALLITGCARQPGTTANDQSLPSAGQVTGNLTINGKAEALKQIYTRRVEAQPDGKRASIDLLLANQPLSEELVEKLFTEADQLYSEPEMLKDSTIQALYLNIPKYHHQTGQKVIYDATLLTSKYVLHPNDISKTQFTEFDLKKGVIKAKTSCEWEATTYDENMNDVKMKCSYSVDFQTTLKATAGQDAGAEKNASQPPGQGTASGKMMYKGETVALNYAYAKRYKLFFDEPEEYLVVLLTDKAIPEASRLEVLQRNNRLNSYFELQGIILSIDQFGSIQGGAVESKSDSLSTNYFTPKQCTLENGRIKGNFKYDKENSMNKNDGRDFSVAFDAPLQ
jgi:hypothetical protein